MGDVGHAYTISDGNYLYLWNDFTAAASKMKISEVATDQKPNQAETAGTAGLDQKRDFLCENWSVDNSLFNPPADKNFKEVTEEINQAVQELNGGEAKKINQQICDMCQKAPTQELRDKCLGEIKCD